MDVQSEKRSDDSSLIRIRHSVFGLLNSCWKFNILCFYDNNICYFYHTGEIVFDIPLFFWISQLFNHGNRSFYSFALLDLIENILIKLCDRGEILAKNLFVCFGFGFGILFKYFPILIKLKYKFWLHSKFHVFY